MQRLIIFQVNNCISEKKGGLCFLFFIYSFYLLNINSFQFLLTLRFASLYYVGCSRSKFDGQFKFNCCCCCCWNAIALISSLCNPIICNMNECKSMIINTYTMSKLQWFFFFYCHCFCWVFDWNQTHSMNIKRIYINMPIVEFVLLSYKLFVCVYSACLAISNASNP